MPINCKHLCRRRLSRRLEARRGRAWGGKHIPCCLQITRWQRPRQLFPYLAGQFKPVVTIILNWVSNPAVVVNGTAIASKRASQPCFGRTNGRCDEQATGHAWHRSRFLQTVDPPMTPWRGSGPGHSRTTVARRVVLDGSLAGCRCQAGCERRVIQGAKRMRRSHVTLPPGLILGWGS